MIQALLAFLLSALLALGLIPLLSRLALRIGLVDNPDNNRKLHKTAIPLVGGIAVFFGTFLITPLVLYFVRDGVKYSQAVDLKELIGLAIGAAMILGIGVLDDRFTIRGRQKLFVQILAATVLIGFGYRFEEVVFFGMEIKFGIFSAIVIYFWMLAATNSVNLLDGADGFASTIGIVMCLALSFMNLYQGKIIDATLVMAMCGALVAFMKFNFPPAKAYLGDAGSMLIGFVLGAVAIRCSFKQPSFYAFMAPIAMLGIPFLDTGAAIVRRRLTGRSIYAVDRGHLHHQLSKSGYGPRASLLWVACLCSITAVGAGLSLVWQHSIYALISVMIVVGALLLSRIFGGAEAQLVSNKALSVGKSFIKMGGRDKLVDDNVIHVQGNMDWSELWDEVCTFAKDHKLNRIAFDLNMPWLHESFHATRQIKKAKKGLEHEWNASIPLMSDGRSFGRIEVFGAKDVDVDHHGILMNLIKLASHLETELNSITNRSQEESAINANESQELLDDPAKV